MAALAPLRCLRPPSAVMPCAPTSRQRPSSVRRRSTAPSRRPPSPAASTASGGNPSLTLKPLTLTIAPSRLHPSPAASTAPGARLLPAKPNCSCAPRALGALST
eukprot:6379994-Prymnesium_polylepis.1